MHMDIAVFKSITNDRMEVLKNKTYGKRSFNEKYRKIDWKMSISMFFSSLL
ncbi:hypothetical protein [Oceanobacillus bengalensis]|uniref:hypothetical protein n=1 Tax=Oceanobacillus bengalensis TaxID=1435466 RepID=UPI001601995F|nr:hypothetical protein [Oceanobacillus bengalensis]